MTAHFLRELQEARARGGWTPAKLWLRTAWDALWIASGEHLQRLRAPTGPDARAGIRRGRIDRTRTTARPRTSERRRGTVMADLPADVRFALRGLRRNPSFAVVAIVTVSLGIGASATALSVLEAVVLRPLPFDEPDRLVQLREESALVGETSIRPANLVDWQERSTVFTGIAGLDVYSDPRVNLSGDLEATRVRASRVTSNFFDVLGAHAAMGRTLDADDGRSGASPAAVISHRLWVETFRGDPSVLDRTVRLNDRDHRIVGVMPPDFHYPERDGSQSELWIPGAVTPETRSDRRAHTLHAVARLRAGVTLEQARAEMGTIASEIAEGHPESIRGPETGAILLFPFHEHLVAPIRSSLVVLCGAVVFVLLITWVNLTNLLLARTEARDRELAVRTAIGGDRLRVGRQLVTETAVLTLVGGLGGLALARWLIILLLSAAPLPGGGGTGLSTGAIPLLSRAEIDGAVITIALLLSLLTGAVCGAVPAIRGVNRSLAIARRTNRAGSARRTGAQLLVVVEVSLSVVLLISVGLLTTTMRRISEIPVGFEPSRALAIGVQLTQERYTNLVEGRPGTASARWTLPVAQQGVVRRTVEQLTAIPGVEGAGATSLLPLHRNPYTAGVHVEGGDRELLRVLDGVAVHAWSSAVTVTPGYFEALGLPLIRGRAFTGEDRSSTALVVIVNQALARLLGLEKPVGTPLQVRDGWVWRSAEIVGVVQDVLRFGYDPIAKRDGVQSPETLYLPYSQPAPLYGAFQVDAHMGVSFVVRHHGDPAVIAEEASEALRRVDGDTPVAYSATLGEYVREGLTERRFLLLLMGLLASVSLLLATVGIYGVMSFHAGRRRHEIGVRLALGAGGDSVVGMIVGEGTRVALLGALGGVATAMGVTRQLSGWLYGVSPTDPTVMYLVSLHRRRVRPASAQSFKKVLFARS